MVSVSSVTLGKCTSNTHGMYVKSDYSYAMTITGAHTFFGRLKNNILNINNTR